MRYMISVQNFRDVSVPRKTPREAVEKAEEMIGAGIREVRITDTDTGRTYGPDEFHLLDKRKTPKGTRRPPQVASL